MVVVYIPRSRVILLTELKFCVSGCQQDNSRTTDQVVEVESGREREREKKKTRKVVVIAENTTGV